MLTSQKLETFIFYLGVLGIFFLPFSISLTQSFIYLSSSILILYLIYKKKIIIDSESKTIFLSTLIFYIWIYISNIINAQYSLVSIKDFFLIFFGVWSYYFVQSEYKEKLLKILTIIFLIFLIVGIVSSFLPFRLPNLLYHLQNGFFFNTKYRAQHLLFRFPLENGNFLGSQFPLGIYIPVGFTGTHLSFGSMMSLISFFYFYRILKAVSIKHMIIFVLISSIIIFSHARSAIFGLTISFVYIFYINLKSKKKLIIFVFLLMFVAFSLYVASLVLPENLLRIFPFYKKHSDYQRTFLWYLSFEVFVKHFIVGVGTLNFSSNIFQEILNTVQEKPLLWYPLYQTEIMHAHNDFVYFLASAGVIGIILFLNIFYQKLKILHHNINFLDKNHYTTKDLFLVFLFSPIYLLFAGMFQCFFLDDYTMQLYWLLYGISLGILKIKKTHNKE